MLPIFPALNSIHQKKNRLRKAGNIIDDFDLLIGATAVTFDIKWLRTILRIFPYFWY